MTFGRYVLTANVTMPWPAVWSEIIGGAVNSPVTAPAVPVTTVTADNASGLPVLVTVTGATVTAITVNGTVTGLTPGAGTASVVVPYPGTIALTYPSGTPTWTWAAAELPQSGSSSMTAAVSATAQAGGQAGTIPQFTWFAGQGLWLDTNGQLYAALGAGNLRAWIDGTDGVSHFGISN